MWGGKARARQPRYTFKEIRSLGQQGGSQDHDPGRALAVQDDAHRQGARRKARPDVDILLKKLR